MATSQGNSRKHKRGHNRPQPYYQHDTGHKVSSYSAVVQEEIKNLFEKKFTFENRGDQDAPWSLPVAEKLFTSAGGQCLDPELQRYKDELNALKNSLSDKEIRKWHQHTYATHRSGLVMQHLRTQLHVELCTQAWCKFHEILSAYTVIPSAGDSPVLNTVHLCEAPGAFVTSLNHYLKRWKGTHEIHWKWLATTLNPYYEGNSTDAMISDDRFILVTPQNWDFGADDSGNLMNPENYNALVETVSRDLGQVHLVTADGSINCQNDPSEQEGAVSQLHYCEAVTALSLLSPGGAFVLKMFTMFEHSTVCLMYLLNCVFQKVHVFKPSTSKAGNSEVYVICLQYGGKERLKDHMSTLKRVFGSTFPAEALFPPDIIPTSFYEQLRKCANLFKSYQMATITENIELFGNQTEDKRHHLEELRMCCLQEYIERYHIRSIRKSEKICPKSKYTRSLQSGCAHGMYFKTINKQLSGTFYERVEDKQKDWLDKLASHSQEETDQAQFCVREDLQNMKELTENEIQRWKVLEGKCLNHVCSSPFCAANILDDWNEACQKSQAFRQYINSASCRPDLNVVSTDCQPVLEVLKENLSGLNRLSCGDTVSCVCLLSASQDGFVHQLSKAGLLSRVLRVQYNIDDTCAIEVVEFHREDAMQNGESWILQAEHLTDYQAMLRLSSSMQSLKLPLLYVDCSESDSPVPSQAELPSRLKLLASVLLAVQVLRIGGVLVLHVSTLLTRFSVGVLSMLHRVFTQVTLLGAPEGNGLKYDTHIICQAYKGAYPALTQYLWKVYNSIVSSAEREVLQLVPIAQLCESTFNQAITTFNCKILSQQTKAIVKAELEKNTEVTCEN